MLGDLWAPTSFEPNNNSNRPISICTAAKLFDDVGGAGPAGRDAAAAVQEFGWTTDQISTALALRFALFGLMGPFAAVLMERWGLRAVMCLGLALVGTGMALVTLASQLWQLFVLWSLLLGLGTGLTALVLGAVVANRWFVARRGLVVGLLDGQRSDGATGLPALRGLDDRTLGLALRHRADLHRLRDSGHAGTGLRAQPPVGPGPGGLWRQGAGRGDAPATRHGDELRHAVQG